MKTFVVIAIAMAGISLIANVMLAGWLVRTRNSLFRIDRKLAEHLALDPRYTEVPE